MLSTESASLPHETVTLEDQGCSSGPARAPRVLVFDSGLGGLTVLAEITRAVPGAVLRYVADDAVFPYGALTEDALVARVVAVMDTLVGVHHPDVIVIACNTASTAVLPPLRARWPAIAFVGTVPAIKPAAALSKSRLVSVLATPGTVKRQYTRDLVARFAEGCAVTLVGAPHLAALAEAAMRGEGTDDAAIAAEVAPVFVEASDGRRTDAVVLACTHYPLLVGTFERLAPWPVTWIDPAPAIARRVVQVAAERGFAASATSQAAPIPAVFTSGRAPSRALSAFLRQRGLEPGAEAPHIVAPICQGTNSASP